MAKKSFDALEEIRPIKRGKVEVVDLGRAQAIRVTFEPGWRWWECVKPIVGTNSCQVAHLFHVHRFDNLGSQDVKALCVITPAAIGPRYFREAAEVINAAAGGPPDRAQMVEIMRRHGLKPASPQA